MKRVQRKNRRLELSKSEIREIVRNLFQEIFLCGGKTQEIYTYTCLKKNIERFCFKKVFYSTSRLKREKDEENSQERLAKRVFYSYT